jgi:hypothetical protein
MKIISPIIDNYDVIKMTQDEMQASESRCNGDNSIIEEWTTKRVSRDIHVDAHAGLIS